MSLEEYYSGDKAWKDLVELAMQDSLSGEYFIGNESVYDFIGEIDELRREVLIVIVAFMGIDRSLWWIKESVPALDDITPIECILKMKRNNKYTKRIRQCLLRFPV